VRGRGVIAETPEQDVPGGQLEQNLVYDLHGDLAAVGIFCTMFRHGSSRHHVTANRRLLSGI
jgi:hypothetical protein